MRVADPDPGTMLGFPDVQALIARINAENPGLLVTGSCPTGRKYENNPWQDRIIDRLRQYRHALRLQRQADPHRRGQQRLPGDRRG